jgi:hypothetical protein
VDVTGNKEKADPAMLETIATYSLLGLLFVMSTAKVLLQAVN